MSQLFHPRYIILQFKSFLEGPQANVNLVFHGKCIHSQMCIHSLENHHNQEETGTHHYQLSFGELLRQFHQSLCLAVNRS
jgi:hypothetical protein